MYQPVDYFLHQNEIFIFVTAPGMLGSNMVAMYLFSASEWFSSNCAFSPLSTKEGYPIIRIFCTSSYKRLSHEFKHKVSIDAQIIVQSNSAFWCV